MCFGRPLISAVISASESVRSSSPRTSSMYPSRSARCRAQPACDPAVVLGLRITERQVLELPLELPDPQPAGERRIDLARFQRGAQLLLAAMPFLTARSRDELQREPHQHKSDIGGQRDQQIAQAVGLLGLETLAPTPLPWDAEAADPAQFERELRRHGSGDLAGLCFLEHCGIQQWHERARQDHVVGGAQPAQDRCDLEAIAARRGRSPARHRLERLAHTGRQRLDVDFGGLHGGPRAAAVDASVRRLQD